MATYDANMRADIYCRISDDRTGRAAGVKRQEEDCRAEAARRGFEVHAVYVDNDLSAYRAKIRPGYRSLVDDLERGAVRTVIAYHPDRLTRHPRELEDLVDLLEGTKAKVLTVQGGDYDLSTSAGRTAARIVGAVARGESERISERVLRANVDSAKAGRPTGGVRKFGFEADAVTIREDEAALIRGALHKIVHEGASVRSIVVSWNAQGITGTRGGRWHPGNLRDLLISARIAGYREYAGELHGAVWPSLVDRDDWDACRVILQNPERRSPGRSATYLLVGTARCGLCGQILESNAGDGYRGYRCPPTTAPRNPGCGGVRRHGPKLEEHVAAALLQKLAERPATIEGYEDTDEAAELVATAERLEKKLQRLEDLVSDGDISKQSFRRRTAQTRSELAAVNDRRGSLTGNRVMADVPTVPELLAKFWEAASIDQRRQILGWTVDRVLVHPTRRGDNRWQADKVEVIWK